MRSLEPARYHRNLKIAALLLVAIVFSGAAVRLTGSGLGCDDWPVCSEGSIAPELAYHSAIEFGNRLFSGIVSLGIAAAVLGAYQRSPRRRDLIWLAWGLVVGVIFQIVWGKYVVESDLHPFFVAVHFLVSMVMLANVLALLNRSQTGPGKATPRHPQTLWHLRAMAALGAAVVLTGTLVTGAGPHSGDVSVERIDTPLTSIARIHSLFVWGFLAALVALSWRLSKNDGSHQLNRSLHIVIGAAVLQGAIGYTQYFTGVPVVLVFIHIVGATALWCALVWTYLAFFARPSEQLL